MRSLTDEAPRPEDDAVLLCSHWSVCWPRISSFKTSLNCSSESSRKGPECASFWGLLSAHGPVITFMCKTKCHKQWKCDQARGKGHILVPCVMIHLSLVVLGLRLFSWRAECISIWLPCCLLDVKGQVGHVYLNIRVAVHLIKTRLRQSERQEVDIYSNTQYTQSKQYKNTILTSD